MSIRQYLPSLKKPTRSESSSRMRSSMVVFPKPKTLSCRKTNALWFCQMGPSQPVTPEERNGSDPADGRGGFALTFSLPEASEPEEKGVGSADELVPGHDVLNDLRSNAHNHELAAQPESQQRSAIVLGKSRQREVLTVELPREPAQP